MLIASFGVKVNMEQMKIRLAIITSIPFPIGMAATNRILSYSKGLTESGNDVTVLTTNFGAKKRSYENYNTIHCKTFRKKKSINLINKICLPLAVIKMVFFLFRNKHHFNIVLLVSNSAVLIVLTYLVCKISKLKFIQEKSEFPFVLNKKSFFGKIYAKLYVNFIYKLFDGMIIMTNPLNDYFKNKTSKLCKKIVVPMTVEPERFSIESKPQINEEYIAYCGYMGGNKDGLINLITSFGFIQEKYPSLKLLLIGYANEDEMYNLKQYVLNAKISNVVFWGNVERDKIPELLCNAKILALARPSSLQSSGGFPTKLGEYLSTGKPVVVTSVGEIPIYLKDNENAFLVAPDDNQAFARKIEFIIENYEFALEVAKKGKRLTEDIFNYKVQSERIHNYLIELLH